MELCLVLVVGEGGIGGGRWVRAGGGAGAGGGEVLVGVVPKWFAKLSQ